MAGATSVTALLGLLSLIRSGQDYVSVAAGQSTCGRRSPLPPSNNDLRQPRIIGGVEAMAAQYPWLVSVQLRRAHLCGGSLISRSAVLSAAHCYVGRRAAQLSVVSGEYDLTTNAESPQSRHAVAAIHSHADFVPRTFANDVAVVQLARPVAAWDAWRQPVCLPRPDMPLPAGRRATVAGWGWTAEPARGGSRADRVRHVHVPLLAGDTCRSWFSLAAHRLSLHAGQMCAGVKQGGRDGCSGDSGGPLVVADRRDATVSVQVGVVSAGKGCGRPNLPGIYTDLRHYIAWIVQTLSKFESALQN